jgi:hypothetical protein
MPYTEVYKFRGIGFGITDEWLRYFYRPMIYIVGLSGKWHYFDIDMLGSAYPPVGSIKVIQSLEGSPNAHGKFRDEAFQDAMVRIVAWDQTAERSSYFEYWNGEVDRILSNNRDWESRN